MNEEELAERLYETYCEAVGGKAFNGDRLPSWQEFRTDAAKRMQSDAWVKVAAAAAAAPKGTDRFAEDRLTR